MKVSDVMATELFTLNRNDELSVAGDIMKMKRVRHIPVLDEGRLVGIVSQRDLFHASLSNAMTGSRARDQFLHTLVAKEVMTDDVVTIEPTKTLEDAARLMLEHGIGCLPVVDSGELVGLVTESDLLRVIAER